MRFLNFLRGYVRLTVTGASPTDFFNRLANLGISFWAPVLLDDFTAAVSIYPHALRQAQQAAARCQCEIEETRLYGFRAVFYGLKHRPVLLAGLVLSVLLAQFFSGRIWSIEVEGCQSYHPQQIIRALEDLGVGFGSTGKGLDIQRLETQMKLKLDNLEWFTINVYGSRAEVIIRERRETPALVEPGAVCNVVAGQAGLVTRLRVYAGAALVEPGQAVEAGQLLVSGVVEHAVTTRLTHAMAEVYARTWRRTGAVAPLSYLEKGAEVQTRTRYGLILGKKRFNFGQNSGISGGVYDKIITTGTLCLPGGLTLPVVWVRETATVCSLTPVRAGPAQVQARLETLTASWLLGQMNAGTLEGSLWSPQVSGNCLRLAGLHECTEQIGRTAPITVQWMVNNTEDDGDYSKRRADGTDHQRIRFLR